MGGVPLEVLNFVTVTLYGNVIMYLFTEEEKDRVRLLGLAVLYLFCGALNLFLHRHFSDELLYMLYPFTVHLPLLVYYVTAVGTPLYRAIFALTAAYMLTTPRKWISVAAAYLCGGGVAASAASEIIVSAVLLWLIAKFMAPAVIGIFKSNANEADWLCLPTATAYLVTYAVTVYSDALVRFPSVTIPVLTTLLSVFFIVFEIYFFEYLSKKTQLRYRRDLFDVQLHSVKKLAEYIGGGEEFFCKNKMANAFLSMYKKAAEKKGVLFVCNCNLPEETADFDMLAVLTTLLDDALYGAEKFVKAEVLQNKLQICINISTDAPGVYGNTALDTVEAIVSANNGMLYTDMNRYQIKISIRKGVIIS